ncbi:MAG TPA: TIGR04211 family SH3 domain-containing protein [Steroidobacteraceae bacterium]|nr:TIGR04211 family SH3 domain-containing protein [Steroidobacteraceae bacterium]
MKVPAIVLLALLAADGRAATAYVTDELVLGVYAEQNSQGQRLATLHSGASLETLASNGDFTQVRLADGTTGWVKTVYLTSKEPAMMRIKQLQAELDRSRATTPALAEAAERSEVERLTRELSSRQSESGTTEMAPVGASAGSRTAHGDAAPATAPSLWLWMATICSALVCGFWLGYAALARRVKNKFGGIKVY